jgi:hypothetical protein
MWTVALILAYLPAKFAARLLADLDPETQALLGQILDIIEAPTKGVRFDQPALPRGNRE